MKQYKHWLWLLCLFLCSTFLLAEDNIVYAKGEGRTYREAINNALYLAIEQNCGLVLSGTERTQLEESSTEIFSNKGNSSKIELTDAIQKTLDKVAKGRILRFEIVSDEENPITKKHQVEIKAVLPGKYVLGIDTSNRRKIAMLPLTHQRSYYSVGTKGISADKVTEDLLNGFNQHFSQSRRFSVLSRQDQQAINREKQLIENEAPASEWKKLGQTLGLDYMVTGSVSDLQITPVKEKTIVASGTRISYIEHARLSLSYRVVLVATGEIKWANTITVDLTAQQLAECNYDYATIYQYLIDSSIRGVAQMLENIYPIRVAAMLSNGQIVLDQGGSLLQPGMIYEVLREGEEIFQEATGESLGFTEETICKIRIIRVTPKMSYAAVLPKTGTITRDDIKKGVVARLTQEFYNPPAAPVQPQAAPIIKLPFD